MTFESSLPLPPLSDFQLIVYPVFFVNSTAKKINFHLITGASLYPTITLLIRSWLVES